MYAKVKCSYTIEGSYDSVKDRFTSKNTGTYTKELPTSDEYS